MSTKMLIDAAHPEETRVAVVDSNRVEDFDFESSTKKQIRGNIYLAKVTRVEPSLQACFVEYGGNKHGFLAFNEIHPDYYQIPYEDRQKLREAEAEIAGDFNAEPVENGDGETESAGADDEEIVEEAARKRRQLLRKYKIQEVIKRRQVLLVQVAKEERGNKGAALTTYLSLAGRYCVLMPNTARGGGISRKIAQAADRKRLKSIVGELDVPQGMGLIIRTAGASRTKLEVKRDYEYLLRLWETIRELTLKSSAPTLIYEEGNLVKRAIRDLYDKDIEEVLVEGEEAYKEAKAFMRMLMPSHAKKVQHYKDDTPLFQRHQVESQLEAIYSPVAQLKSGGYIVINPTEALVSIDVNSGKSTKERNIEQTALRTNLEAAEEAARQMRLRDLAGLLVIDFIDMEENKNIRAVEKKMKDALRKDRARLQVGRISQFGLMEMSRQRRRTSLMEGSTQVCSHCGGSGFMRSIESSALLALRTLEEEGIRGRTAKAGLRVPMEIALYLLNEKREHLHAIEARFDMKVIVTADDSLIRPHLELERIETRKEAARAEKEARAEAPLVTEADVEPRVIQAEEEIEEEIEEETEAEAETEIEAEEETREPRPARAEREESEDEGGRKRRRRGRRGGRGRRRRGGEKPRETDASAGEEPSEEARPAESEADVLAVVEPVGGDDLTATTGEAPKRKRPQRRRRAEGAPEAEGEAEAEAEAPAQSAEPVPAEAEAREEAEPAKTEKPKRRRRKKTPEAAAERATQEGEAAAEAEAPVEAETPVEEQTQAKPKRARRPRKSAAATKSGADATGAEPEKAEDEAPKPKRRTRKKKAEPESEAEAAPEVAKTGPAGIPEERERPAQTDASETEASEEDGQPRKRGWWQRSGKIFGLGSD